MAPAPSTRPTPLPAADIVPKQSGVRRVIEIVAAFCVGPVAMVIPVVASAGTRYHPSPVFPLIRTGVEEMSATSLLLLVGLSGVIGALTRSSGVLLGILTMAALPCVAGLEMLVDGQSHNLWPIEFAFYSMLTVPAVAGVYLGRHARRLVPMTPSSRLRRFIKWAGLLAGILIGISWAVSLPWWWSYLRKTSINVEDELAISLKQGCLSLDVGAVFGPSTPAFGGGLSVALCPFSLRPVWKPSYNHPAPSFLRIVLPLWIPFLLVTIPAGFIGWVDRRRIPSHCCQKCGYDLTGNMSGICPECGTPSSVTSKCCQAELHGVESTVMSRSYKPLCRFLGIVLIAGIGILIYRHQTRIPAMPLGDGGVGIYSLREKPDAAHETKVIDPEGRLWFHGQSPGASMKDFDPASVVVQPCPGGGYAVGLSTRDARGSVILARWSAEHAGQRGGILVGGRLVWVGAIKELNSGYMQIPAYPTETEARKVADFIKQGGRLDTEPGG